MSRRTNGHHPEESPDGEEANAVDGAGGTTGNRGKALSIETDGLQLIYSDGTEAVRDVSLSVPEGEFFGFLGANGAGKTTAIKVLATLLKPTNGEAFINGFDAESEPREIRESIGYMAQEIGIDEELTARENLQFACAAYGVPRGERSERIEELLALVDLAGVADQRSESFSGGMQKRLDAATALVHRPPLVFLDEPTTGLDPNGAREMRELIRQESERGATIFFSSHILSQVEAVCDTVGILQSGQLIAKDSVEGLRDAVQGGMTLWVTLADPASDVGTVEDTVSGLEGASVTETDGDRVAIGCNSTQKMDVLNALNDAGVDVANFETEDQSLEELFTAYTEQEVKA